MTDEHEATDAMGMESQRDEGPLSGKSGESLPLSDWINGTPDVPVGSPTWCAWATHEIMNRRATTRSVSSEAVVALEPFALLVGYGDPANATVSMDDPISKWLTVAQLQDAARVMNSLLNQARKPEGGGDA